MTGTVPEPGGATTAISLSEMACRPEARRSPNQTESTSPTLSPVMSTGVDPEAGPEDGASERREMYVYAPGTPPGVEPCAVLTVTLTTPVPGGAVASITEPDKILNRGDRFAPNMTAVTLLKPVP